MENQYVCERCGCEIQSSAGLYLCLECANDLEAEMIEWKENFMEYHGFTAFEMEFYG